MLDGTIATLANTWRAIDRWRWVMRYHRPQQLARRLYRNLKHPEWIRWCSSDTPKPDESIFGMTTAAAMTIEDLANSRLTLINLTRDLGWPIDWRLRSWPQAPLLWAFHLHYHEFLCRAIEAGRGEAPAWAIVWQIIADWLDAMTLNGPGARIAWHPYCISRRLVAWTRLLRLADPPPSLAERMRESIARQASFLVRHLERDIGGNHLWDNARALATAGVLLDLPAAKRWRRLGIRLLQRCVAEQVLPHGEHYERSAMYQEDLAAGLVELAGRLEPAERAASEQFRDVGQRMTTFVDGLRHPDGGIPLFGDATLDFDAPRPPVGDFAGRHGDYFIDRSGGDVLLFDAGDLCPDHLPAHAHADLLGIEMSVGGRRLLVDSGVYSYSGPARGRYRSSAAHNVLTVEGVELADVWGDFRMGRRGHVIDRGAGTVDSGRWCRAAHDAYRHLGISDVVRILFIAGTNGPYFSVHVAIGGPPGGEHRFVEYVHFAPEASVVLNARAAVIQRADRRILWEPATERAEIRQTTGRYSPSFYREQPNAVLELRPSSELPALSAWALSLTGEPAEPTAALADDRLLITWMAAGSRHCATIPIR